jgi:mannosyltransferase
LRLFRLGSQSLWIDEVFTWSSANVGGPFVLRQLLEDVHGPLYSLVLHFWCSLAGGGEWALRLPSALFGAALVPATARLAERWLGRATAVPAAWLTAGAPFLVWYSQEARNYSLLMLCAVWSALALLGLGRRVTARGVAGGVAAVWAGLLSNLSFALLAPLHLRWWLGEAGGRRRRVGVLAGAALAVALLLAPWAPQIAHTWDWSRLHRGRAQAGETPLRGGTTFHAAAVPFALHAFAVGYTLGPSLRELRGAEPSRTLRRHLPELAATTVVFGGLGLLGLGALARRRRLTDALLWLLVPAAVVSYFALHNFKVFHPRYLAVSMPAFLLMLAAALADLRPRARLALGLAVAALWGASLRNHYFDPRYGKEDYRAAAALVAARGGPDEKVLVAGAQEPMFYYYPGPLPVERFWLGHAADPSRLAQKLDRALAGSRGVWVVVSRPEDLDPRNAFARLLETRYPDAERFSPEGVRVWHLRFGVPARGAERVRGAPAAD